MFENDPDLLVKAFDLAMANSERTFTNQALGALVELMFKCHKPDYVRLCQVIGAATFFPEFKFHFHVSKNMSK